MHTQTHTAAQSIRPFINNLPFSISFVDISHYTTRVVLRQRPYSSFHHAFPGRIIFNIDRDFIFPLCRPDTTRQGFLHYCKPLYHYTLFAYKCQNALDAPAHAAVQRSQSYTTPSKNRSIIMMIFCVYAWQANTGLMMIYTLDRLYRALFEGMLLRAKPYDEKHGW